jgi:exosortase A-associated hydrolase 2
VAGDLPEEPFFFAGERCRLFGVLHRPKLFPTKGCFVFCHPFAEEKLWTHRVYVSFARELAGRGHWVLRFDTTGNGDSEGELSTTTVESALADIGSAIEILKTRAEASEVSLLGMRLGATFAAAVAAQREDIDRLVLWEPVVDGGRYMQEILRSNLTTQLAVHGKVVETRDDLVAKMEAGETVNVDGYEIAFPLFEQISNLNTCGLGAMFSRPTLISHIGKDGQPLRKDIKALTESYPDVSVALVVEEPFWREIKRFYGRANGLFESTLNWLEGSRV